MTINIPAPTAFTWGLHHPRHGLVRFLLVDRAVFVIYPGPVDGTQTYTLHEKADAAAAQDHAVKITANYEAHGWQMGNIIWTHPAQANFEDFLHDARSNPPWVLSELNVIIDLLVHHGEVLT